MTASPSCLLNASSNCRLIASICCTSEGIAGMALKGLGAAGVAACSWPSSSSGSIKLDVKMTIGINNCVFISGDYLLLGVVVGDGVAANAGATFQVSTRIFQSSPSRITNQYPLVCVGPKFSPLIVVLHPP